MTVTDGRTDRQTDNATVHWDKTISIQFRDVIWGQQGHYHHWQLP